MRRRWSFILTLVAIACDGDMNEPPRAVSVASVTLEPDSAVLTRAATYRFTVTVRDDKGNVLPGRAVGWTTSDQGRVAVDGSGKVTAVAGGRAVIRATSDDKTDSAYVIVRDPAINYKLEYAGFTQAIQPIVGEIPIVVGGIAAVVNVHVSRELRDAVLPGVRVVLRLYNSSATLIRTDTARTDSIVNWGGYGDVPDAQFLIPADVLAPGLQWQVEIDPRRESGDRDWTNNTYPSNGLRKSLLTTTVPPLKIRFVPIRLAAHGNSMVSVTASQIPQYLHKARSVLPLGSVTATIGAPLSTAAVFGTPPNGGESAFWQQVLQELDVARVTNTSDPQEYWFGLLHPPQGFTYTTFGGFGYIPSSGQATGASTRTAVAVALGWFNLSSYSTELVAHELGHNFGRRHAPCDGAGNPDPAFPRPDGFIGNSGYDVFSWATGLGSSALTIAWYTGDVMGYCYPTWVSPYTYQGVLAFRGLVAAAASTQVPIRSRVLIVRGHVQDGRSIQLEPALVLNGRPTLPESSGPYILEGRAEGGRILFTHSFEPAVLDHAPTTRSFMFALPISAQDEIDLATLEVRGPVGVARMQRPVAPVAQRPGMPLASLERLGQSLNVRCADASTRALAVLDDRGMLLGMTRGNSLPLSARPGARLTIACSDGIRTTSFEQVVR